DGQLVRIAVDLDALRARDAFLGHLLELRLQPGGREGLAAQPAAAESSPAKRQIDARIVKPRQDGLLDLIEGQRTAADAVREALERAWNLPNALRRVLRRPLGNRIMVDHGLQDDRVVGIEPVCE